MFWLVMTLLGTPMESPSVWVPAPPCAPFTHGPLPMQKTVTPLIFPVIGKARWGRHYGVNRAYTRHTGIDIAAPKMSPIVASFDGIIGFKRESFWIYGKNGWIILGTHLNDDNLGTRDHRASRDFMFAPNLVPGMSVKAGQFIGYVGESGNATGPHLHFELYAPGRGPIQSRIRNPFFSLKQAQVLKAPRYSLRESQARPKKGQLRLEACIRRVNPAKKKIQVILLAKQSPKGSVTPITKPRFVSLHLSDKALADLGGWDALRNMSHTQPAALYVPYTKGISGARVDSALTHWPEL